MVFANESCNPSSINNAAHFDVSRIPETSKRQIYFVRPRRRRSSLAEMVPSFVTRARERSIIFKNLRLVLSATVSSSAFRIGTTAARGLPSLMTITGSFMANAEVLSLVVIGTCSCGFVAVNSYSLRYRADATCSAPGITQRVVSQDTDTHCR